jgi:hypothetical protein
MNVLESTMFTFSLLTLCLYIPRLTSLSFWKNKLSVVILHIALSNASAWASYKAYTGGVDMGDIAGAVGAFCWIFVSFQTWRKGQIPDHFTKPVPLDEDEWQHVVGRGKE